MSAIARVPFDRTLSIAPTGRGQQPPCAPIYVSHQCARGDDSWPEACHRGLTRVFARAPSSKLPFASAIVHLGHNLKAYARMGRREQQWVHGAMRKYRLVCHMQPKFANKVVVPSMLSRAVVLRQVYRLGEPRFARLGNGVGATRQLRVPQRLQVQLLVATLSYEMC